MRKGLITTNDQRPEPLVAKEPEKLNIIITKIIPNALPPVEQKGTDLSRMLTTHDLEEKVDIELARPVDVVKEDAKPGMGKKPGRSKGAAKEK